MSAAVRADVVSLRQPEGPEPYRSRTEIAKFIGMSFPRVRRGLRRACTTGGSDLHCPHLVGHAKGDSGEQGKFIPLCHGGHMVAPGSSGPAPMRTWSDRREDGTAI
jgi:hypothetical protein